MGENFEGEMGDAFDEFIRSLSSVSESDYAELEGDEDEVDEETRNMFDAGLLDYEGTERNLNPYKDEEEPKQPEDTVELGGGKKLVIPEEITEDSIKEYAPLLYPEKKVLRSLVLEFFTPQMLLELEKLARTHSLSDNQKVDKIKDMLKKWDIPYNPLGPGTNRLGIMVDGYVLKIALDGDGKIDNCREFIYSMQLQPYVIKCYEIAPNGIVGVFEYVEGFTLDDFYKNQSRMREILKKIAANFLIGDVGISSVNYLNWGFRGEEIVILDFAYIYSVKFKVFTCQCSPTSVLYYDKDFNTLICKNCKKAYDFRTIRKKISRKDQELEIGDVTKKGYVISSSEEEVPFDPNFTEGARDAILKKLMKLHKKQNRISAFKDKPVQEVNDDPYEISTDVNDIIREVYERQQSERRKRNG